MESFSMNLSLQFEKRRFQNLIRLPMLDEFIITILETTPDVVHVPINLSSQF